MSRAVVVLRPEPGAARTVARLEALGLTTLRLPLFAVTPVAWTPPDPAVYDCLLLTSANAARHAGPGLAALATLPVVAVGAETAAAARAAGLAVAVTGDRDAAAAIDLARAAGFVQLLHLAGRDRAADFGLDTITIYSSDPLGPPPRDIATLAGVVVLLHSSRAARRFAALAARARLDRADVRIAAISDAVAGAAGEGWRAIRVAPAPDDAALALVARDLAIDPPRDGGDKAA